MNGRKKFIHTQYRYIEICRKAVVLKTETEIEGYNNINLRFNF